MLLADDAQRDALAPVLHCRVILSSNPLWNVGNVETLEAQITQQSDGTVTGSVNLDTFALTVTGEVRGEGGSFSIYATGEILIEDCEMEVRAVIAGEVNESTLPTAIAGAMALRFTGNFEGLGCTEEHRESYPGTGADFEHMETRVDL